MSAIAGVGTTIGHIDEISTSVAAAVEQQEASTQEIARNVQQAAVGTREVSSHILGVRQAADQTDHAAHEVLDAASELSRHCGNLRQSVHDFLRDVRAV
jgi:methyl-accepting chemotaxis protein